METNKFICVGGGVGPMAGVDLRRKIILQTDVKNDQGHHNIIHISFSNSLPDRSEYLEELEKKVVHL